jgi:hypothetical protein
MNFMAVHEQNFVRLHVILSTLRIEHAVDVLSPQEFQTLFAALGKRADRCCWRGLLNPQNVTTGRNTPAVSLLNNFISKEPKVF